MTTLIARTTFKDIVADTYRQEGERFEVEDKARAEALTRGYLAWTEEQFTHAWGDAPDRQLSPLGWSRYASAVPAKGERWLQALQLTYYDPGSSVYRYHSALNTVPGLISAFGRFQHANPCCDLRQIDAESQPQTLDYAFKTADVIHVHMDYRTLYHGLGRLPEKRQLLVRHYHGSRFPGDPGGSTFVDDAQDEKHEALRVGARLYFKRYNDNIHWLPIPMPVLDYAKLAHDNFTFSGDRPLRIAHSPTVRALKGTEQLIDAVKQLRAKGLMLELVLIEGKTHDEALKLKATCDATFDSFWLGLQGSGLEAASMGQLVIAGDPSARNEYVKHLGECPYTYAPEKKDLIEALERAATDRDWRFAEANRVHAYVRKHHDYPAVAERYLEIVKPAWEARQ
jgi:hypothetical protein